MKARKLSPVKVPLDPKNSAKFPASPGVFILYRSENSPPAYVGRNDSRIRESLEQYMSNDEYKFFKYMKCRDAKEAFEWECMFWHKGQSSIHNSEKFGGSHPTPPDGSILSCPYPGCNHEFGPIRPLSHSSGIYENQP